MTDFFISVLDQSHERPSSHQIMLSFAELLAKRSTCRRLHVGCVVTDNEMLQVLGIGYNGNARGLPNGCDTDEPGACGCIHAELNALLKSPGVLQNKFLFTTTAPCKSCAKAIVNAGVAEVWFRNLYRSIAGLWTLADAHIEATQLSIDGTMTDWSSYGLLEATRLQQELNPE